MTSPLVRNIIRTFSTQVGSQLIAVILGIVIARTLGPPGKGFASYAATAVSLVTVFFFGFGDAVIYQFGKNKRPARAVHAVTMRILLGMLAIFVPLFIIVGVVVPSQRPLAAAAAVLPFAIYTQLITPFLMVRDRIGFVNLRTIVQSVGNALLTIPLLLLTHLGLEAVIGIWIVFYAVAAVQSALAIKPILKGSTLDNEPLRNLMGEQIRFGTRAAGASAAGFLNLRVDIFVVSVMFAPAALGSYTLAIASGELLWQVSRAFVWSAIGRIGSDSFGDSAALVARLTRNTLAIVGSLGVVAFIVGPWFIVHIYGQGFSPAGNALRWALPGLVAYAAEVALTNFIILQLGRPLALVWVQSVAAIVCAVLTFTTAGRFGIDAAAASTSLTKLVVTIVLLSMFVRGTGISLRRLLIVQQEDLQHYMRVIEGMLRTMRLRSA